MENIFQILIVIGIIVFAVIKQLSDSAEEAKKKRSKGSAPKRYTETTETEFDDDPIPPPFLSFDYKPSPPPPPAETPKAITSSLPPIPEDPEDEQEFDIHPVEEARRGIIWSEILKRKY